MSAAAGLNGIPYFWNKKAPNWNRIDPYGDKWIGITYTGDRITFMLESA